MPHADAEVWLRKAVSNAPRPLPKGRFPALMAAARRHGLSHDALMDVLDRWLNYGYCRITEHINNDIEVLPEGYAYFYRTLP